MSVRLRLIVATVFLLSASLASGQQRNEAQIAMKNAVGAFQAGLFYEAEESFLIVERAKPNVPDVLHGLAMCCFQTRRFDAAVEYFKRLLALPKPQAQFVNKFAAVYDEMGKPDLAMPLYEKAIEIDAKFAPAWFGSGRIRARRGETDDARKRLVKAIELDPRHVDAHYELASVEFLDGHYEEADRFARKALALSPRHVGARFLIARAALKAKRTDEGKRLLAEAQSMQKEEDRRALDARRIGSYLDLAFESRRKGAIRESIVYFGEVLKIDPAHAQAKSALTTMEKVLRESGRTAEADFCLRTLGGAR